MHLVRIARDHGKSIQESFPGPRPPPAFRSILRLDDTIIEEPTEITSSASGGQSDDVDESNTGEYHDCEQDSKRRRVPFHEWLRNDDPLMDPGSSDEESENDLRSKYSEDADSDTDPDICHVCSSSRDWKNLFECSLCLAYIHVKCFNDNFGTNLTQPPRGKVACSGRSCKLKFLGSMKADKFNHGREDGFPNGIENQLQSRVATDGESGDDEYNNGNVEDVNWEPDFTSSFVSESPLGRATVALCELAKSSPHTFAAARLYLETGTSVPSSFLDLIRDADFALLEKNASNLSDAGKRAVLSALPPQNIRRVLEKCSFGAVKTKLLRLPFRSDNVEASFNFRFRDICEAAVDLYQSQVLSGAGPQFDWRAERCSTGIMPELRPKITAFATYNEIDVNDPKVLILPIGLYTDDSQSASGNVDFGPCWVKLLTCDPSVNFMLKEKAHALVGLLPDIKALEYRYTHESSGSAESAQSSLIHSKKQKAAAYFRREALRVLLQTIVASEEHGREILIDGQNRRVYLVLCAYVADMKERRLLLGMRTGVYDCSHCYAFPGKVGSKEAHSLGARASIKDSEFRKQFLAEKSSIDTVKALKASKAKQFAQAFGHLGLTLEDTCVFTDQPDSTPFMVEGPSEIFLFDSLHMKDGIILYYFAFLQARLGDGFATESSRFGNVYLGTKRDAMHVMERGIESFHAVPVAVILGKVATYIDDEERHDIYLGACDLLIILQYLTDPCPEFVLEKLQLAVDRFHRHVIDLLDRIGTQDKLKKTHKVTTKMHELFSHMTDQIRSAGLPNAFSSKIFETFHQIIKYLFTTSSKRRGDGSWYGEIVSTAFYRAAMQEACFKLDSRKQAYMARQEPWKAVARFHVANNDRKLKRGALFKRNIATVLSKVFQLTNTELPRYPVVDSELTFGSSLTMSIECAHRSIPISHVTKAVVPGTSLGELVSGGSYNAIVFQNDAKENESDAKFSHAKPAFWMTCKVPGCLSRHHDADFNLFCSSARDSDSGFGVPILFFDGFVLLLKFSKVSKSKALFPRHPAILEVVCDTREVSMIPFNRIRGICMFRPLDDHLESKTCVLYPGRNVFGYLTR